MKVGQAAIRCRYNSCASVAEYEQRHTGAPDWALPVCLYHAKLSEQYLASFRRDGLHVVRIDVGWE